MPFWGGSGSGSADPCLWLMDPDSDPDSGSCYFRHWPSRCQQKTNFLTQFFLLITFFKVHLHHLSKIKSQKESQNSRNQGFSCYFCMMIEGSGSGSIPLTSGSGSVKPKNMWIRWIRIRNTAFKECCGSALVRKPSWKARSQVYLLMLANSLASGSGCGSATSIRIPIGIQERQINAAMQIRIHNTAFKYKFARLILKVRSWIRSHTL